MKIASIKYSECHSPSEAMSLMLETNLLPLYNIIMKDTDLGQVK